MRKRCRRRILVVAQFVLLLLLFFLLGARVGPPPYSRSFALGYLILFLLLPLYRTRTSGRTMDEREFALRDAAHVWAYNVLCISLSIVVAAYFFSGSHVRGVLASFLPTISLFALPAIAFLPNTGVLWLEPDWLEDRKHATLPLVLAVANGMVILDVLVLIHYVRSPLAVIAVTLIIPMALISWLVWQRVREELN